MFGVCVCVFVRRAIAGSFSYVSSDHGFRHNAPTIRILIALRGDLSYCVVIRALAEP